MSFDRKAFNAAIETFKVADNDHKCQRSFYMKEIRALGVDLRKKLCKEGGLAKWVQTSFFEDDSNPLKYGVDVCFEGTNPECAEAIINYMQEEGWQNARVHTTLTFITRIQGH